MSELLDLLKTKDLNKIEAALSENESLKTLHIDDTINAFHLTLLVKSYKSYDVARMLTKYFDINEQDKAGKTVLFYAVIMGNTEATKFFVSNGGNVLIKDNEGRTAADQILMLDLQNSSALSRILLKAAG